MGVAEPTAGFLLRRLVVAANGRTVDVTANADLQDKRPGISYLWRLRVYRGPKGNQVMKEHYYLDQMFRMSPELKMSPTFDERMRLPSGEYRVEVALYHLPDGFDVRKLGDDALAHSYQAFRVDKPVTVAD